MIRHNDITIDKKTLTISRWFIGPDFCGAVSHRWQYKTRLSIRFRLVQHLIMTDGVTLGGLFDLLYNDDASGGPDQGIEAIRVMLCHSKPYLAKLGLQLTSEKIAGRMYYRVARQTA